MALTGLEERALAKIAYYDLDWDPDMVGEVSVYDALYCKMSQSEYKEFLKEYQITEETLKEWKVVGTWDKNAENGFYACIIETGPGEAAVGFRGSEDMGEIDHFINDWILADAGLLNSEMTTQQAEVVNFMRENMDLLSQYQLTPLGHSLGGNLGEYFTILSVRMGLSDNIEKCVSIDGPGYSQEFINEYRDDIAQMADRMEHPRMSLVGDMLNDLPGVHYFDVGTNGDNPISRHFLDNMEMDEATKSYAPGEKVIVAKICSQITEGIDHLPAPIGNTALVILSATLISAMWVKDKMFDDSGKLTTGGKVVVSGLATGAMAVISVYGLPTVLTTVLSIVIALVAVVFVVGAAIMLYEFMYDMITAIVDKVCEFVGEVFDWVAEKVSELKDAVVNIIKNVKSWFKENFNQGYKYAMANPEIIVDTYKLRDYADRLQAIRKRVNGLDSRLDSLYWKVGFQDLWNLMQADLLTGYSYKLSKCISYLKDTASDFESAETDINNSL